jgi:hypothetical protein
MNSFLFSLLMAAPHWGALTPPSFFFLSTVFGYFHHGSFILLYFCCLVFVCLFKGLKKFFYSIVISTQELTLARQALCNLSHNSSLFCFNYFYIRYCVFAWSGKQSSSLCLPHVGKIMGIGHTWLIG